MCQHHPQRANPGGQMSAPRGLGCRRQSSYPQQSCNRKGHHGNDLKGVFLPSALPSVPHVWPHGTTRVLAPRMATRAPSARPLPALRTLPLPESPGTGRAIPLTAKPGAHQPRHVPAAAPAGSPRGSAAAAPLRAPGLPQNPALPSAPRGAPAAPFPGAPAALPRAPRTRVAAPTPLPCRAGAPRVPGGTCRGWPRAAPSGPAAIGSFKGGRGAVCLSVRPSVRPPARPARCRGRPYRGAPGALSGRSGRGPGGLRGAAGAGHGAPSSRASPALPPALTSRLCN